VGLVFVAITGALGMAQILVGAGTKDLADGWAAAAPGEKPAYFAAFDGAWNETVNLDFGTIMAGGLYLLTLAAAILSGSVYARWLGWVSAGAGVLLLVGTVLELWSPVGTALGLVGILLLLLVLSGLGISMWRNAAFHAQTVQTPVEPQDVT